jgi:hypothetical protein
MMGSSFNSTENAKFGASTLLNRDSRWRQLRTGSLARRAMAPIVQRTIERKTPHKLRRTILLEHTDL